MTEPSIFSGVAATPSILATTVNHAPAVPFADDASVADGSDRAMLEVGRLTDALIQKFEELTMIHQFTEQLRIDIDRESICRELIEPLAHCIHAVTLAIELYADPEIEVPHSLTQTGLSRDPAWLVGVADAVKTICGDSLTIVNQPFLQGESTRRVVVVPIARGDYRAGRMIAIGDDQAEEFGSIEADLMRSTSMMLAGHLANQRQYIQLRETLNGALSALVSALDAKDRYTYGHSARVSELSVALARDLKMSDSECENLRKAALLHDIGKIGVDDAVLRKHGKLTDEEFLEIQKHPVIGYDILKAIGAFEPLLPGVLHHHESWDGTGYPHRLQGEEIPRIAQIIAVADAFDAMTSDRPYRDGMPIERVLGIFKEGIGVQWAPDVATLLVTQIDAMFKLVKAKRTPD
ncbi:MAG: HD-GYP domain-containing protein [Planctomycetaceae bacterium]